MESQEREALLAEEALIILHSGEIPEIAFHSSLYYLAEDPDGPKLTLAAEEIVPLQQAVSSRYREIILRTWRRKTLRKEFTGGWRAVRPTGTGGLPSARGRTLIP